MRDDYQALLANYLATGFGHALGENEVESLGSELFRRPALAGGRFHWAGVSAADDLASPPPLAKGRAAIINTRARASGGEHWLALIDGPDSAGILRRFCYDSFGRGPKKLNPAFAGRGWVMTHPEPEQGSTEVNCGARCLAWLGVAALHGPAVVAAVL